MSFISFVSAYSHACIFPFFGLRTRIKRSNFIQGQSAREAAAANALERLKDVQDKIVHAVDAVQHLIPVVLQLVKTFTSCVRSNVLHQASSISLAQQQPPFTKEESSALLACLAVVGNKCEATQVWSLTQFYSVDFSKSRIDVKKCVFNKRTIKVCVSCC